MRVGHCLSVEGGEINRSVCFETGSGVPAASLWRLPPPLWGHPAMPGDYVIQATAGNPNVTPEMIARLRQLYGLDQGILQGYWNWLSGALAGDLGESFVYRVPVAQVIGEKMWVSFALAFTALLLQIVIAVPVGVFCAVRRRSRGDHLLSGLALLGSCLPAFFFAAILQKIFAVDLQWLPLQGLVNARADYGGFRLVLDKAAHLILPVSVFVVTGVGNLIRFVRGNVLEALQADYIRAARAKGLSERRGGLPPRPAQLASALYHASVRDFSRALFRRADC